MIGFVLVCVAQGVGYLALPLALRGGGSDHDQAAGYVYLTFGAVLLQAAGVMVWARGKRQPFWFGLVLAPLGCVAILVLLMTPTREPQ